MNVKEFYEYITSKMTPEEALMKMLEGGLIEYKKLKFDEKGKEVHPMIIISMAALDMGWAIAVEDKKVSTHIRGLSLGTSEYMKELFKGNIKFSDN